MERNDETLKKWQIREANELFDCSTSVSTGWSMYDSAVEYFGREYLEGLSISVGYRKQHEELLGPFTVQEAQERADMYERMFPRVLLARQILERQYADLLTGWFADSNLTIEYTDVLADIISRHPSYTLAFGDQSSEQEHKDNCHGVAQWLHGWLRSEYQE